MKGRSFLEVVLVFAGLMILARWRYAVMASWGASEMAQMYVSGLLMLLIFYAALQWLPPGRLSDWASAVVQSPAFHQYTGMNTIDALLNGRLDVFADAGRHLILPAIAVGTIPLAIIARMTRSSLLDVMGLDYIRTARAKGLKERLVVFRHAFRNALLPIITIVGLQLGSLLGGAILTETIFGLPGMGTVMVTSIFARDYPVLQAAVVLIALIFVVVNLLVDISYAYLDPRIRLQ